MVLSLVVHEALEFAIPAITLEHFSFYRSAHPLDSKVREV